MNNYSVLLCRMGEGGNCTNIRRPRRMKSLTRSSVLWPKSSDHWNTSIQWDSFWGVDFLKEWGYSTSSITITCEWRIGHLGTGWLLFTGTPPKSCECQITVKVQVSDFTYWHCFALLVMFSNYFKGGTQKKIRDYLGNCPNMGGGLPNSQNFCKLTKSFLCAKFILRC